MYFGELGQGSTGERFRVTAGLGARPAVCPAGTTQESAGRFPSGATYANCHRAAQFAPPAVTTTTISPVIRTTVPTSVATQVSPQISPTLAQQQASPGAAVSSAPQSAPGGPSTGITGEDLQRILAAQRAAQAAEDAARERTRQIELENLRREMAERSRASEDIRLAEQKAAADRAEAERFAREQAEAMAAQSAGAVPPPASMAYVPTGGGALPQMIDVVASTLPEAFAPPATEVAVSETKTEAGLPWPLLLAAAAGVVLLAGGKRKSRAKK